MRGRTIHEEAEEKELACELDTICFTGREHEEDNIAQLPADEAFLGSFRGPFPLADEVGDDFPVDLVVGRVNWGIW